MFCFPCATRSQRIRVLDGDLTQYRCCAGRLPCCQSQCDSCSSGNESCCLCLEILCFPTCAVLNTRHHIQTRWSVQNSCFDNCVLYCMCLCSLVDCVLRCLGHSNPDLSCSADALYCAFLCCINVQHDTEMDVYLGDATVHPAPAQKSMIR